MSYTRFGLYYVPPEGDLSTFGAAWLGWDVIRGVAADRLSIGDLDDVTMTPRKYGFHGTLKPPFRLAEGCTQAGLEQATADLARTIAPANCGALTLHRLGRFLALTPTGDLSGLAAVASRCVMGLDSFRAPAAAAELARRRAAGLTATQEKHLLAWGYPYVLDEFRFHLTLTGAVDPDRIAHWEAVIAAALPPLPDTFDVTSVALVGERADGNFELIHRYALTG